MKLNPTKMDTGIVSLKSILLKRVSLCFLLVLGLTSTASGTEFELSRIARDINFASSYLAKEVKYSRGFGSVGQRADRLAREAAQLVEAIRRNRSSSYVRSQFDDVSRRYNDLEDVFLRANRNYTDEFVFNQVGVISNLYSELSSVFFYSNLYRRQPQIYTFVSPNRSYPQNRVPPVYAPGNSSVRYGQQPEERITAAERNENHRSAVEERLSRAQERVRSGQRVIRRSDAQEPLSDLP